ncbi:MAG: glycosyltransferase [Phycisphaerales bacterium]
MSARVLMIADRDFAVREHGLLERVERGISGPGLDIARAVPVGVHGWDVSSLTAMIEYDDSSGLFRAFTAPDAIHEALAGGGREAVFASGRPVDIVHAWGIGAYRIAMAVAHDCEASLVIDVSSEYAMSELRRLRKGVAELLEYDGPRVCVVAADEALAAMAQARLPDADARVVPWGVPVPKESREPRDEDAPVSISVMCTGRSRRDVVRALDAIAEVRTAHERVIVFLDEQALDRTASIHRHIEAVGLDDCLSVIGNMESARHLILETDVLVAPDTRHEHRSLVIEALAHGMRVVAHSGGFLPEPVDRRPYALVPRGDTHALAAAIGAALTADEEASHDARRYATSGHTVRAHVRGVLEAYESLIGAPSVPITSG